MTQTVEQYDAAIATGIKLFMRRGFINVSIDDIIAATDLNRYSIYSAFGTKADFFEVCVRRYCAIAVNSLLRLVSDESLSPKDAACANLYAAAEEMCEIGAGCLVSEYITEMKELTPELADFCFEYYKKKEEILKGFFARVKQAGAISNDIDADQVAAAFMIFKFGLSNEVKRSTDIKALKLKIDAFISAMFR